MSVRILHDSLRRKSCLYDSTSGRAFGPIFDRDEAFDFIDWMADDSDRPDPRTLGANTLDIWVEAWETARDEGNEA